MSYKNLSKHVIKEINQTLSGISEKDVQQLLEYVVQANNVFFIGVGRVKLSLEAIAKRWTHLGINCYIVGQITEPAITNQDLLIVGSGSGESLFPLMIAKKAHEFGAKIVHIGANQNSSMNAYSELLVRIPTHTKMSQSDEVKSIQPMTSLFEQSLLLFGDILSLLIMEKQTISKEDLWKQHANLE